MGPNLVRPVTFPPPVLTGSGSTGPSFDISATMAPRGSSQLGWSGGLGKGLSQR
jgi:hypothetical protein